ncbi:MAG: ABC transporter ATP-binding protein [Acidimicrobiales bacterium]
MIPSGSVIEAEGLAKHFGETKALKSLTLTVKPGEIVGVIGPSGSGKTTAVRLVIGAYEPTAGSLRLWGTPVDQLSTSVKANIGYLPQHPALLPHLSINENLHLHASLVGLSAFKRSDRFADMLELVDLAGAGKTKVAAASGGMKRRAALAAALVHDPQLIVLDEPTAGIDPVLRQQLWEHFEHLASEGRTLLITTQYVGEARYCDRVAVIVEGELVAFETPKGLRHRVFGGDVIDIEFDREVPSDQLARIAELPGVRSAPEITGRRSVSVVTDSAGEVIALIGPLLIEAGCPATSLEERIVDFDAMFVELVRTSASKPLAMRP